MKYALKELLEVAENTISETLTVSIYSPLRADSVFEYGYCTEFILLLLNSKTDTKSFDHSGFISKLETLGESIVSVCDGEIVKVHIHTFQPDKVLELGHKYGEFLNVKIENMSVQHNETQAEAAEKVKYAVVAACSGDGIKSYFTESFQF